MIIPRDAHPAAELLDERERWAVPVRVRHWLVTDGGIDRVV
jgi:hypothetical protein